MRWKWFVGIIVFLIIALMVTVYAVLATYDYNKLKPSVARMVKDATGRLLRLGGDINLKIGFSPSLVVTDLALANVSWGSQPQMIEIEKLEAQVRLLPLLFKDVKVNQIGLFGVKVLFETGPNAQGNWDFFMGNDSAESTGVFRPTAIDIGQVSIDNLQFTFLSHKTGTKTQFALISLAMSRQETEDVLMLNLRADYNGQPLTLTGKTGRVRDIFTHQQFPFQLSGSLAYAEVKIKGAIDDVLNLQGIGLDAQLTGKNLATFGPVLDIKLPETKTFGVTGSLRGSKGSLRLENIIGNLSGSGVDIAVSGSVGDLIAFRSLDLKLKSSGKDLAVIAPVIGEKLPATDEFKIQGRLTGSSKVITFQEAQGSARRGSMSIKADGSIKDLLTLSGMDLHASLKGKSLRGFGEIIGEKLPATDEFAVEGRLTGYYDALSLKNAQASAKQGSLGVTLTGEVQDLLAFSGLNLQIKGAGKSLAEIGPLIDQKLPATDQFAVQGRLTGSPNALSLREARGSATRGRLSIALNGKITNLIGISGVDLKLKGSGKDLAEVGAIIGQKLPVTDQFAVEARVTGSSKSLSLRQAKGHASRGSLNLTLSGGIATLPALNGISINLKAYGKELAEIGPLVGAELPELGPFNVSGKLAGSAKSIALNAFSAVIDKSDFNGQARLEVLKRPKLTVRLESSVIDSTALIKSLEKDHQETTNKDRQNHRLFSDDPLPFDLLKKVDAEIVLKAKNIHAKDVRLEFGHLALKLENHDFSIDKLEATYKETKISGNLQIKAGTLPQVVTHFLVQGFNLGDFLKETGKNDQIRAVIDIAAHGDSRGNSVHSLMANLDGAIGAVMGEGYLTKYLNFLSSGLTQKVFQIWKPHKAVDQIKCAVVRFDIKEGVAASQAFVFDTQAGVLTGKGEINLGTEKINFLLVPKPAHPDLSILTNLRVSGSVIDPHVSVAKASALTQSVKALSALAVGPLGLLAPFVHLGANKSHPCEVSSIGQLGLNNPAKK
jgi:uncharacterized protein involved in outer membrane biogenesis